MSAAFPQYAWAWPEGSHDLMIRAAALADPDEAVAAFREWLASNDLEAAHYREQRLLVTVSARLSDRLTDRAERARLVGVERMLWAKSRLALQAAQETLAVLSKAGIEVMVIKGAARAVTDISGLRGRVANDVDLLVRPAELEASYQLLSSAGWIGEAPHSPTVGAIHLERGRLGTIDLHRYAYHQPILADRDGGGIWARATRHDFLGYKVWLPSPTDSLLLAIAHGGIDNHKHSDWLVDSALIVRDGAVDWPLFERLVAERGLDATTAIALTYIAERLRAPVPADTLERIARRGRRNPLELASALLQSRPRQALSPAANVARGVFRGSRQVARGVVLWRLRRAFSAGAASAG